MTRKGMKQFPVFVDAMVATATKVLQEQAALPPGRAHAAAVSIARGVCDQFKRCRIYVPYFDEPRLAERDEEILVAYEKPGPDDARPYTPQRVRQIADDFQLTCEQVYSIIKHHRDQEAARRGGPSAGASS